MRYIFCLLAFVLFVNCSNAQNAPSVNYIKQLDAWDAQRVAELKADNGWLNLVGLFWLDEGKNTFGSGSQNALVFPAGSIDENAGYFELTGNTVKLVTDKPDIQIDGKPAGNIIIFSDDIQNVPVVSAGSLRWSVIKRADKIGIRVRDLKSPVPAAFKGIERFAADAHWVIPAKLDTTANSAGIMITNKIGQTTKQTSPGRLVFKISKKQYTLDVLDDGADLLVVFGDVTNGKATYPSGRFIDVKKPGADGLATIDFNMAYNPPCAFTDFATCPLPPAQNKLPIAVTAGEKNYRHHH